MKILLLLFLASLELSAATLSSTRLKVDTWLTNQWPTIVARQNAYYSSHGRYWQGLLTCTGTNGIPNFTAAADGDATMDNLNSRPYYQIESISDLFPALVGVSLPAAFTCNQYDGPSGKGYVVTVYVRWNGTIYRRAQNNGPETWRSFYWQVYDPRFNPQLP